MTDPDEAELSALAKKLLATPPKRREAAIFGKVKGDAKPKKREPEPGKRKPDH